MFIGYFILFSPSCPELMRFLQDWSELGTQIAETSIALNLAEKEVLEVLRREVRIIILIM